MLNFDVDSLSVHYGTFCAVHAVSLNVKKGETLGIAGESGCGKTSLIKALVGLQRSFSGTFRWGDDVMSVNSSEKEWRIWRQKVQMVFQDPHTALNPRMTLAAMFDEVLCANTTLSRRERSLRTDELLESVEIDCEAKQRYPHQFSGGQRQRIGIARALAVNPEILILDEPVSALDVSVQAHVLTLLERLKRHHNLTYLFVTHDLAVLNAFCDRALVMYRGHLLESGEAYTLTHAPCHPYTQALIGAIPNIREGLTSTYVPLQGESHGGDGHEKGCPFVRRCPHATALCQDKKPPAQQRKGQMWHCHYCMP